MTTKITKLSVLAFLGLGLVAYGQSGKVGINTGKPAATLEIQPTSTNLAGTTNEGFIAPKLSKTRIAAIASPVEGTLVYATDEADSKISDYTGTNTKVAKITEKGYYYYNGTEWVKSGVSPNGELWAQRDNNGVTETYLKPADTDGNSFQYNGGGVGYTGKSKDNTSTGGVYIDHAGIYAGRYNYAGYGPNLLLKAGRGTSQSPAANQIHDNLGRIVWSPTLGTDKSEGWGSIIQTNITEIESPTSYATNVSIGGRALGKNYPNTYTLVVEGKNDRVGIGTGTPEEKLHVHAGTIRGPRFRVQEPGQVGPIIELVNPSKEGTEQAYKWNIYNMTDIDSVEGGYKDALVFWSYNKDNVVSESNRPQFIITDKGNVGIGVNYIYNNTPALTEKLEVAGSIKSTALAGDGLKSVMADENGKLVVGTSATALGLWTNDANNNLARLATTSDGTTARTNDNRVTIADDGAVTAKSFMGYSGATIFPDYVFQKYYTGTSSLKSDYSFKTLSQVEDFVKTNGHLPGYQSAEAIKKQGYIDLMAIQLTNVEKIEELYLHSIEQDKAIKAKDAKIAELEARLQKLEALLVK
ncbi:hypothetical protein PG279_01545 [Riemerella anatipestifer]|nr:hypothetical protein [Riemerella anatipestifer]